MRINGRARLVMLLVALFLTIAVTGPARAAAPLDYRGSGDVDGRGALVRSEFVLALTREEVAQGLGAIGWPDVLVKSGVALYRLAYTTINAHGALTVASGLFALPTDVEPLGVVSFGHGTDSLKRYVPSAPTLEAEAVAGLFASGGFALVAPDYLGLGESSGPHPYLHADTEASASLDLLTAARHAARASNVALPSSVYITGFSQGGQTALALDRAIEMDTDSPWQVVAVAPIAGPYDLSGTEFPGMLEGIASSDAAYAAYLALSYLQVYGTATPADVFVSPYDTQVASLFDGQHAFDEIASALPTPRALFRPEFVAAVGDGTSPFAWQLRQNDTDLVTPRAPVRLYYGTADVDVPPRNAQVAELAMRSVGVRVTAVDLGPSIDHPLSEQLGLPAARAWFDEIAARR
jgi:pimeloyl-ACP methyl ester carboxylesterase